MMGDQEKQDSGVEIEADTPIGKLAAKGMRVSDIIALATFGGIVAIATLAWQIGAALNEHQKETHLASSQFTTAIKMQTCIMSIPQEKREQEYMSPNGFCRQMASAVQ